MRGLRIKNLVRQDYGFVIQFCQVTELLSVEKEHSSVALALGRDELLATAQSRARARPRARFARVFEVFSICLQRALAKRTRGP
jgi:hypothetical protein